MSEASTTFMVSRYGDNPEKGNSLCASVGLKYGLWTKSSTAVAAYDFLNEKFVGDELWFGMEKTLEFSTTTRSECPTVPLNQLTDALKWTSSSAVKVPNDIFTAHTVDFYQCSDMHITVKKESGKLKYRNVNRSKKKFLCSEEVELPQPFLKDTGSYQKPTEAHQKSCVPKSARLARFYTKNDMFAYRRLLHELHNPALLGLIKESNFNAEESGCPKDSAPLATYSNLAAWMNSPGSDAVNAALFPADDVYDLNKCNEMCFTMEVVDKNLVKMKDVKCSDHFLVICMSECLEEEGSCSKCLVCCRGSIFF